MTWTKMVTGASLLLEAALHDRERRGGHDEGHHAEGDHRARGRHHVGGLGDDLEQWPLRAGYVLGLHHRELDEAQDGEDDGVDDDHRRRSSPGTIGCQRSGVQRARVGPTMPAITPPEVT